MIFRQSCFLKVAFILLSSLILTSCTKETINNYIQDPAKTQSQPPTATGQQAAMQDGTINGGGGKGVYCHRPTGESVELLDFYEARILYGLEIPENLNSQEEAVHKLAQLIAKHFAGPYESGVSEIELNLVKSRINSLVLSKIKFIDSGKKIKLINDAFEPLIESGCEMLQVAVYYDESTLLVDKNLWNKMNWTHKIGLVAHEAIYLISRQKGATNSIMTRKLVGHLFSREGAVPTMYGVPRKNEKPRMNCIVNDTKGAFVGASYAFETKINDFGGEVEGLELVFNSLYKHPILFRTSLFFNGYKLNQIHESCDANDPICTGENNISTPLLIQSYESTKTEAHLTIRPAPRKIDASPIPKPPMLPPDAKPIIPPIDKPTDPKETIHGGNQAGETIKRDIILTLSSEASEKEPVTYLLKCTRLIDTAPIEDVKPIPGKP